MKKNMASSYKTKRTRFEVCIIFLLLVSIIVALLADTSLVSLPSFLLHKFDDSDGLLLTLFSVQASVSTLGIALVSIIAGNTDKTIYGISTTRYITKIKPIFITHNRLILFSLLLIIVNYVSMSLGFFNLSVALFIISVVATMLLSSEIFVIFLGEDQLKRDIQQYVLENYSISILNDLNDEMLIAIETGNSLTIDKDCDMLLDVFKTETEKSEYTATVITEHIVKIVCAGFEKISHLHNPSRTNHFLQFICDLYDVANRNGSVPLRLHLWPEIDTAFFRALGDLQYEQLREASPHLKLHFRIYKNLNGASSEELKTSELSRFLGWVYYALFADSNHFLEKENTRLKESLFQHAYFYIADNKTLTSDLQRTALIDVCYLIKAAIDSGDTTTITKQYISHFKFSHDDMRDISCMITIIYLYYLSCRENLIKGKPLQEHAKKILSENKGIVANFVCHNPCVLNLDSSQYTFIQSILNRWEYMENGEVKCMIIDKAVADFFIFAAVLRCWYQKDLSNFVKKIVQDSTFSIYSRYFSDSKFEVLRNNIIEFASLFFPYMKEDTITEIIILLKEVLDDQYRAETIAKGIENAISPEQLKSLSDKTTEAIQTIIDKHPILKSFGTRKKGDLLIEKENILLANIVIPNFLLQEKDYMRYLHEDLEFGILFIFVNAIRDYITISSIDPNSKEKQETLIQQLQESNLSANIAMVSKETFWGERNRNLLKDFIADMTKIQLPAAIDCYYLLDSTLLQFSLHDVRIEFEDLTWDDIMKSCRETEDGGVEFNVTNNLYIPFEKEDLQKHFSNTRKKMIVYVNYTLRQPTEQIGVGIEVDHE